MVLQLEDCTKILKALNPVNDFIFLFGHPCGHYRVIENRLNVMKTISGYGEAQQEMHPTNIKQEVGYLGPHEQIIEVGDDNAMVFQEGSNVTFCMTPQERVATNFSHYDDP